MFYRLAAAGMLCLAISQIHADEPPPTLNLHAQIVSVQNPGAITDFQPNDAVVQAMVDCGVTNLTGNASVAEAWRSLVAPQEIVGLKVFSEPGMLSGTRPAVVAAVIRGLLAAGLPAKNIIIWDKHDADLRAAGFFRLAAQFGVRAAGSMETGYDPDIFTNPIPPSSAI